VLKVDRRDWHQHVYHPAAAACLSRMCPHLAEVAVDDDAAAAAADFPPRVPSRVRLPGAAVAAGVSLASARAAPRRLQQRRWCRLRRGGGAEAAEAPRGGSALQPKPSRDISTCLSSSGVRPSKPGGPWGEA